MSSLAKLSGIINHKIFRNFLVFSGFLFSLSRLIRGADNFYVIALLSLSLLLFINIKTIFSKKISIVLFWFLPFGIWTLLSSLWSLEPIISFARGLFYIFISSSAVLISFFYKNKLTDLFKIFLALNTLVIFITTVSLVIGIPSDAWTANHGMGFTAVFTHQNSLAAVLMFTLIGPTYYLLNACLPYSRQIILNKSCHSGLDPESNRMLINTGSKKDADLHQHDTGNEPDSNPKYGEMSNQVHDDKSSNGIPKWLNWESVFFLILIVLNILFIYLSYSRAVMLALFIGGVGLVFLLSSLKTNITFVLISIIVGTSLYYFVGDDLQSYLKKGGNDYSGRRQILWEPSYKAAVNGGLIGLGYGVTDPSIESNYKKENRLGEVKREKGNSILALIEETGVVGLILFFLPVFVILKKYIIKKPSFMLSMPLLISSLLAFIVHTQFEGWMVGVSSFSLFVYLIVVTTLMYSNIEER